MHVSVLLSTYNRSQILRRSLESLAAQKLPPCAEWEVLVIDNNSTDKTREVIEEFRGRFPGRFRYIFERRQGKSHALNTGIQQARGDVLAFIDDDVTAEPGWLDKLTVCFQGNEYGGAGGRILPDWTCPPPAWLPPDPRYAFAPFALFDLGLDSGLLKEPPYGTNMAFRKTIFARYGGFRTDLGPNPANLIRGEDTEFGSRLLAAGERLYYEPSAIVHHPVTQDRARKAYFLSWWYAKGRSEVRQQSTDSRLHFWGIPLVLFRRVVVWTLRWMLTVKPGERFQCKLNLWFVAGLICENYRRVRADYQDPHRHTSGGKRPLARPPANS